MQLQVRAGTPYVRRAACDGQVCPRQRGGCCAERSVGASVPMPWAVRQEEGLFWDRRGQNRVLQGRAKLPTNCGPYRLLQPLPSIAGNPIHASFRLWPKPGLRSLVSGLPNVYSERGTACMTPGVLQPLCAQKQASRRSLSIAVGSSDGPVVFRLAYTHCETSHVCRPSPKSWVQQMIRPAP